MVEGIPSISEDPSHFYSLEHPSKKSIDTQIKHCGIHAIETLLNLPIAIQTPLDLPNAIQTLLDMTLSLIHI